MNSRERCLLYPSSLFVNDLKSFAREMDNLARLVNDGQISVNSKVSQEILKDQFVKLQAMRLRILGLPHKSNSGSNP